MVRAPESYRTRTAAEERFGDHGWRTILASSSGYCPLCHKFIAKNHSPIVRLPFPIPVLTLDGSTHFRTGKALHFDGRRIAVGSPKGWCHAACRDSYWDQLEAFVKQAKIWVYDRDLHRADGRRVVLPIVQRILAEQARAAY